MDAKIHYVTVGVVDFEGLPTSCITCELNEALGDNRITHVISIESQELKNWGDSNPLNFSDKSSAEFKKLFNKE